MVWNCPEPPGIVTEPPLRRQRRTVDTRDLGLDSRSHGLSCHVTDQARSTVSDVITMKVASSFLCVFACAFALSAMNSPAGMGVMSEEADPAADVVADATPAGFTAEQETAMEEGKESY